MLLVMPLTLVLGPHSKEQGFSMHLRDADLKDFTSLDHPSSLFMCVGIRTTCPFKKTKSAVKEQRFFTVEEYGGHCWTPTQYILPFLPC